MLAAVRNQQERLISYSRYAASYLGRSLLGIQEVCIALMGQGDVSVDTLSQQVLLSYV